MITLMENVNNIQKVKIQAQGVAYHLVGILSILAWVAYKSIVYKTKNV